MAVRKAEELGVLEKKIRRLRGVVESFKTDPVIAFNAWCDDSDGGDDDIGTTRECDVEHCRRVESMFAGMVRRGDIASDICSAGVPCLAFRSMLDTEDRYRFEVATCSREHEGFWGGEWERCRVIDSR